ncbi:MULTISPECIES: sensor histidine kinase [Bacillus]|jgi:Signal transduction histidine kinase|uniref:sensor histidine kinase n=1 Tax=Bacillus TaxID=1386 RepID=UPI0004071DEA|nr:MULTISPECIES: sensor histidine kinase [Bacillus]
MANFRTRARAVDLLGKQQIRDEVTSISELLRNSYDADAEYGNIIINSKKDYIIVCDDGDGMSKEDIEQKWLTIGTHSKTNKTTVITKKGRVKIGEKGIGRLAISLLGDQLILISKKDQKWTVLYLHWELFRNESIFLEDVSIPIQSFENFKALYNFLRNDISTIKKQLADNLSNIENWVGQKRDNILKEIDKFIIDSETFQELFKIEQKGTGTLFYVKNLEKGWDWEAYNQKTKGHAMNRKSRRLKDSLYAFYNIFKKYENEINKNNIFTPSIKINDRDLTDEDYFNEEDLRAYDYSIEGVICNGKFSGVLKINQGEDEPLQIFEENNVNITEGLDPNLFKDCGPIEIKWFFVEGNLRNSSLKNEEHTNITNKLKQIGGIYVFRDGLRILPYGEPGNDFLELEERRTNNAGKYLFSHRRIFGYIEISKLKNSKLTDKSSREGFVENTYYHYFREVNMNLLIWWATSFLGTKEKNDGRRKIRLKKLEEEENKRKIRETELQKQNEYIKNILLKLNDKEINREIEYSNAKKSLENLLAQLKIDSLDISLIPYEALNNLIHTKKNEAQYIIDEFERNMAIDFKERYDLDYSLLEKIEVHRHEVNKDIDQLNSFFQKNLDKQIRTLKQYIDEQLNKTGKKVEVQKMLTNLRIKLTDIPRWMEEEKMEVSNTLIKKLNDKTNVLVKETYRFVDDFFEEINYLNNLIKEKEKTLSQLSSQLDDAHEKTYVKIAKKLYLLDEELNKIKESYSNKKLRLYKEPAFTEIEQKIDQLNKYIFHNNKDDKLIGLLKREVEIYRDISAVGLAAELTSHEFNALYHKIKKDLRILNTKLKNTALNPIVLKIFNAFDSLEKLHQRMSPLYRKSRARRSDIYLYEFIERVAEYFKNDLNRYNINIINDVPKDLKIKEAETILFTPLINLFSNSIYWLIDKELRTIHFYTDENSYNLYIHDSGPGISEHESAYLFEPFYSKRYNGRGLGLYLSQDILKTKGHKLYFIPPENTLVSLPGACFCIKFNKKSLEGELS